MKQTRFCNACGILQMILKGPIDKCDWLWKKAPAAVSSAEVMSCSGLLARQAWQVTST